MNTNDLLKAVANSAIDWSIKRRFPQEKPLRPRDKLRGAKAGFAFCRLAIDLRHEDPQSTYIFTVGTSILDVTAAESLIDQYLELLQEPSFQESPLWIWHTNRILLNFKQTAGPALLASAELHLPKEERLRDKLIVGLLENSFPELPIDRKSKQALAELVLQGRVPFATKSDSVRAEKLAGKMGI